MTTLAPYITAGIGVVLAMNGLGLFDAKITGTGPARVEMSIAAPQAAQINRAGKGDRLAGVAPRFVVPTLIVQGSGPDSTTLAIKVSSPRNLLPDPRRDVPSSVTVESPRRPVGCDPLFSPLAGRVPSTARVCVTDNRQPLNLWTRPQRLG